MNVQKTKDKINVSSQALLPNDFSLQLKHVEEEAFAIWIRTLLQNWRQGTVGCKTRAEVSYSRKKPWKQKGTGRARVGSARSPLWRHGGIIFGPQPRVRTLTVSKKLRSAVLNDALFYALDQKKGIALDWSLQGDHPKTQDAFRALRTIGLHEARVLLMLSSHDALHYASFVNIPNVRIVFFDQLNAYDVAFAEKIVCLKKDVELFKTMVNSWN
jgi:large subunit ribosomal protein L4